VNFFGHAVVASWAPRATPSFVLGAMLPDFATITGARSLEPAHPETRRGVILHHATDEVFHAAPDFLALTGLARARLQQDGLRRGSAWAAAHVGIELLIDGTLVGDERAGDLYLRALRNAEARILCAGDGDASRVGQFLDRARAAGIPHQYTEPQAVAARIARALRSRPRLSLDGGQENVLADVLASVAAEVRGRAGNLLARVRDGVGPRR